LLLLSQHGQRYLTFLRCKCDFSTHAIAHPVPVIYIVHRKLTILYVASEDQTLHSGLGYLVREIQEPAFTFAILPAHLLCLNWKQGPQSSGNCRNKSKVRSFHIIVPLY